MNSSMNFGYGAKDAGTCNFILLLPLLEFKTRNSPEIKPTPVDICFFFSPTNVHLLFEIPRVITIAESHFYTFQTFPSFLLRY